MRLLIAALLFSASSALKIGGGDGEDKASFARGKGSSGDASAVRASSEPAAKPERGADAASASTTPNSITGLASSDRRLLVVGSLNLDVIIEVDRLPAKGENIVARSPNPSTALGGKGANQAIAAARLANGAAVDFVCQFGNDEHAAQLKSTLAASGVGLGSCGQAAKSASGQGLVFLEEDGSVSAVVLGGANEVGWSEEFAASLSATVRGASALLLQREIPEEMNEILAKAAHEAGVPVLQDIGGAERPISDALLALLTYVCPNETELARLTSMPTSTRDEVLAAAKSLQSRGANNVLVTLGSEGSVLLAADGRVVEQPALSVPGGKIVDTTGAGDAYRAAFAVCLVEGRPLPECIRFAAAAGAVAVSRLGAEPSLPTRAECEAVMAGAALPLREAPKTATPKPSSSASASTPSTRGVVPPALHGPSPDGFPLQFGSRLNSMKDRPDLWDGEHNVLGWVARMGTVKGMGLVDFNYPQHLKGVSADEAKAALDKAGLKTGAVCMRYEGEHRQGALTHPKEEMRRKAIEMTIAGGRYAQQLGANELVIWSAFDGYDYHHHVDYHLLWQRVVDGFREICDALPDVRVSLEFKPTDENTRFFAVPSTGAALLLAKEVDRPNFGLTLDIGHMLMAGENPAQSVAMVGGAGKLFGVQLNDGHAKLGAEDGLMFGSVHPALAVEFLHWLQKVKFDGHLYFDTFPRNEDPVREAEYNIRRVKALWAKAERLAAAGIDKLLAAHDAMGSLELIERLEQQAAS